MRNLVYNLEYASTERRKANPVWREERDLRVFAHALRSPAVPGAYRISAVKQVALGVVIGLVTWPVLQWLCG